MTATLITRVETQTYPAARTTLGLAFNQYNLMCHAAPNDQHRPRAVASLYGAILSDCFRNGEVYQLGSARGIACWLPPSRTNLSLWRQIRGGMLALPWHFGIRGFRTLVAYGDVGDRLHHQYAPMPHWFLTAIGVRPSEQGQGVGSSLIRPMLERADAEGLACWLDTHQEKNVRLYEKLGFEVCERATVAGHSISVYGMLRPANGSLTTA